MCRALMYLGKQILVYDLLYKTDSSLIKQTYDPKFMAHFNNLAGFGMAAWDDTSYDSEIPYFYKTNELPFFDRNLKHLAIKIKANCLLAHVRGTTYTEKSIVTKQNTHPFMFEGCKLALAHNGDLESFSSMKFKLLKWIKPELAERIQGTTDSEWVYALLLSQLDNPYEENSIEEVEQAVVNVIEVLRKVREESGIAYASPLNLFITNGHYLIATRFIFDYGHFFGHYNVDHLSYQSLWYTFGAEYGYYENEYKMIGNEVNSSIIIASEPLTRNFTTWVEVPEYSILSAQSSNGEIKINIQDIEEISAKKIYSCS